MPYVLPASAGPRHLRNCPGCTACDGLRGVDAKEAAKQAAEERARLARYNALLDKFETSKADAKDAARAKAKATADEARLREVETIVSEGSKGVVGPAEVVPPPSSPGAQNLPGSGTQMTPASPMFLIAFAAVGLGAVWYMFRK